MTQGSKMVVRPAGWCVIAVAAVVAAAGQATAQWWGGWGGGGVGVASSCFTNCYYPDEDCPNCYNACTCKSAPNCANNCKSPGACSSCYNQCSCSSSNDWSPDGSGGAQFCYGGCVYPDEDCFNCVSDCTCKSAPNCANNCNSPGDCPDCYNACTCKSVPNCANNCNSPGECPSCYNQCECSSSPPPVASPVTPPPTVPPATNGTNWCSTTCNSGQYEGWQIFVAATVNNTAGGSDDPVTIDLPRDCPEEGSVDCDAVDDLVEDVCPENTSECVELDELPSGACGMTCEGPIPVDTDLDGAPLSGNATIHFWATKESLSADECQALCLVLQPACESIEDDVIFTCLNTTEPLPPTVTSAPTTSDLFCTSGECDCELCTAAGQGCGNC